MIISSITISTSKNNKNEILDILLSVKEPTEAKPGCVRTFVCNDAFNGAQVIYIEEWINKQSLVSHIRSPLYRNILAALDMSVKEPIICFYSTCEVEGMELIAKAIKSCSPRRIAPPII